VTQAKPDIPGYRILRRLGHGGMSDIWLAEQVALARPVAIKIVSAGDEAESRLARFRQEAAIVARFDHPNVVGIIEFGETGDGRLFFSMPYVPNGTLAQASLTGDSARVREVLGQVLDALAYVHDHGVVHRDVKPENVLFDSVGRARLADFGVSRSIAGLSRHTRTGETFGSSLYMSPEQARGELPDGRSDLYAVGAIAYELLTGSPPFQGPDHLSVVVAHLQSPVPRLPESLRHWQGWIDTAMAKAADQRFADAAAMRAALARIPETAADDTWLKRLPGWLPQIALPVVVLVLALLGLWRLGSEGSVAEPSTAEAVSAAGAPDDGPRPAAPPAPAVSADAGPEAADAAGPAAAAASPAAGSGVQVSPASTAGDAGAAVAAPSGAAPGPASPSGPGPDDAPAPAAAVTPPVDPAPARSAAVEPARSDPAGRDPPPQAAAPRPRAARTPAATVPPQPKPVTAPAIGSFESVPRIPLFLLAGSREQQLERIDLYLEQGRRTIEADRARVEALRRETDDRALQQRLRAGFDARKSNYEDWRRQLIDLRRRAARS
jgi:hypothetical protein